MCKVPCPWDEGHPLVTAVSRPNRRLFVGHHRTSAKSQAAAMSQAAATRGGLWGHTLGLSPEQWS